MAGTSNIEGGVWAASNGQSSASAGPSAVAGTQGSVLGAIVDDVVKKTLSVQEMQVRLVLIQSNQKRKNI